MRAISLFSGVGGFEQGFESAGIETVLQAENDPYCLEVLARHWPQVERLKDVRDVHERPAIDLVYGGFPCQDLSLAGRRAGLVGDRSGLWFEFYRVLREVRPRWAIVENVPGVLSSDSGRDFGVILQGLEECGFSSISWAVLDAQYFGVPQRRRRVFIVAGPSSGSADQVLSICEGCSGDSAPSRASRKEATGAIAIRTAQTGSNGWGIGTDGQAYTLDGGSVQAVLANPLGAIHYQHKLGNYVPSANGIYVADIAYAISARESKGISKRESQTNFVSYADGVRRLTPLECERLMGWPDEWTRFSSDGKEISDSHRYRMCGNGVVSNVARWIGTRLVHEDNRIRGLIEDGKTA